MPLRPARSRAAHTCCALLILCLAFGTAPARADVLDDAERLIRGNDARRAYELLDPLEFERAGDPRFDYLLGVAALAAGQPGRATLAFERVLAVDARHGAARLDLGRAWFALGDMERARAEFDAVMAMNPPPAARATIDQYLAAIAARADKPGTAVTGFLEAGFGSDSNVNAATEQSLVYLPFFGLNAVLDPASVETADSYAQLGAGVNLTRHLGGESSLFGVLDGQARRHQDAELFDSEAFSVRFGYSRGHDAPRRATLFVQEYDRNDGQDYRLAGLLGEWYRKLGVRTRVHYFGQYAQLRYGQSLYEVNDYDQLVLGAGLLHATSLKTLFAGSLFAGGEQAVNHRADGDKAILGLRLGAQRVFGAATTGYVNAGYQDGGYRETNLIFDTKRKDRVFDVNAGLDWRVTQHWVLRPRVVYVRQASNIVIYEYDRLDVSLLLRRDFR
jgi:tetratricopeptide (TPR) repeat protein